MIVPFFTTKLVFSVEVYATSVLPMKDSSAFNFNSEMGVGGQRVEAADDHAELWDSSFGRVVGISLDGESQEVTGSMTLLACTEILMSCAATLGIIWTGGKRRKVSQ